MFQKKNQIYSYEYKRVSSLLDTPTVERDKETFLSLEWIVVAKMNISDEKKAEEGE